VPTLAERLTGLTRQQIDALGLRKLSEGGSAAQNVALLNAAQSRTVFRETGSLVSDIIRTAKPGIALVTAGLALPALAAVPKPSTNGGQSVPDLRDILLSVAGAFAAQLPAPRLPSPVPRAPTPAPLPRPGAPAPAPGRRPLPIPLPVPIPGGSVSDLFGGGQRKRRRMNVLNPKALKRSAARIKGFYKTIRGVESLLRRALPRPRSIPSHGHKVVSFKKAR
jgi:hypothetical protein